MLARCIKRIKDVVKYYPLPQIEACFHASLSLAKTYETTGHYRLALEEFAKAELLLFSHYEKISKGHPDYSLHKERLHLALLNQRQQFYGEVFEFHQSIASLSRQAHISLNDYYESSKLLKEALLTARQNNLVDEIYIKLSLLQTYASLYKLEYIISHANKNTINRNRFKALQLEIAKEVTPTTALIEFYENTLLPLAKKEAFIDYIQKKITNLKTPPVKPTPIVKLRKTSSFTQEVASSSTKPPLAVEEKKAPTPINTVEFPCASFFAPAPQAQIVTKYKKPYVKKKPAKESKEVLIPTKKNSPKSRDATHPPILKVPQEIPVSAYQEEKAKKAELFVQKLLIKHSEAKTKIKEAALKLKETAQSASKSKSKKIKKLKPLAAITLLNHQGDKEKIADFQHDFIAAVSTNTPARVLIKGGYIPFIKLLSESKSLNPRYYPQDFDLAVNSKSAEMTKKIDAIAFSAGLKMKEEKTSSIKPYLNFIYPLGATFNCEITRTTPGYKSVDYVTPLNLFLRINKHGFIFQLRSDLITHIDEEKLNYIEKLYAEKKYAVEPYQSSYKSYAQRCHKYYRIFTQGYGFTCTPEILIRLFSADALAPCFKNTLTAMNELKKYLEWIKDLYLKYPDETLELNRMSMPVLQAFIKGWYENQDRGLSSVRIQENINIMMDPAFIDKFRSKLISTTDEYIQTIIQNLFLEVANYPLFSDNAVALFNSRSTPAPASTLSFPPLRA